MQIFTDLLGRNPRKSVSDASIIRENPRAKIRNTSSFMSSTNFCSLRIKLFNFCN
jgi:hypothetical protein